MISATFAFYFFGKLASHEVLQGPSWIKVSPHHFLHEIKNRLFFIEGCSCNCEGTTQAHSKHPPQHVHWKALSEHDKIYQ